MNLYATQKQSILSLQEQSWSRSFFFEEDHLILSKALAQNKIAYLPVRSDGIPLLMPFPGFVPSVRTKPFPPPMLLCDTSDPTELWQEILLWSHRHVQIRWPHLLLACQLASDSGADTPKLLQLPLPWGQVHLWHPRLHELANLLSAMRPGGAHWDQGMLLSLSQWPEEEKKIILFWCSHLRLTRSQTVQFWDGMSEIRMTDRRLDRFHQRFSRGDTSPDASAFLQNLTTFLHPRQTRLRKDLAQRLEEMHIPPDIRVSIQGDDPNRPLSLQMGLPGIEDLEIIINAHRNR